MLSIEESILGPAPGREDEDEVEEIKSMIAAAEGSRGDYHVESKSKGYGKFQITRDSTWKEWSIKHTGEEKDITVPDNQESVMSAQIREWKRKGYTRAQMLREHNSGQPNEPRKGVNKYGEPFDTEDYVRRGLESVGMAERPQPESETQQPSESLSMEERILGPRPGKAPSRAAAMSELDMTRARLAEMEKEAPDEPPPKKGLSGGLWSFAKNAGLGFGKGMTTGIPALGGSIIEFFGDVSGEESTEAVGKGIRDWAEKKGDEWFGKAPEETLDWIAYKGAEMFGPSAVPGGLAKVGLRALMGIGGLVKDARIASEVVTGLKAANKLEEAATKAKEATALLDKAKRAAKVANRIGDISVASAFGMQQFESTKGLALEAAALLEKDGKMVEAEIMRSKARGLAPALSGIIEGIGEYLGSKYLGKLMGLDEAAVAGRSGKQKIVDFLKTLLMENVTEVGQAGGEAAVEKYFGIRPAANILMESLSVIGPTTFLTLFTGVGGGALSKGATETLGLSKEDAAKKKEEIEEQLDMEEMESEMTQTTPWTADVAGTWVDTKGKDLEKYGITLDKGVIGEDGALHVSAVESRELTNKEVTKVDKILGTGAEVDERTGAYVGEDDLGRSLRVMFLERFEKKAPGGALGKILEEEIAVEEPVKKAEGVTTAEVAAPAPVAEAEPVEAKAAQPAAVAKEAVEKTTPVAPEDIREQIDDRVDELRAAKVPVGKIEEDEVLTDLRYQLKQALLRQPTAERVPAETGEPTSIVGKLEARLERQEKENIAARLARAAEMLKPVEKPVYGEDAKQFEARRQDRLDYIARVKAQQDKDSAEAAEGKRDEELSKAEKEAFDTAFAAKDENKLMEVLSRRYGKYADPDEIADMAKAMANEDYRAQLKEKGIAEEARRVTVKEQLATSKAAKATKAAQQADLAAQKGTVMGRPVERPYKEPWGNEMVFNRWKTLHDIAGLKAANDALPSIKAEVAKDNEAKAKAATVTRKAAPPVEKKVSTKPPSAAELYTSLIGKSKDEVYAAFEDKNVTVKRVRELAKHMGVVGYAKGKRDVLVRKIAMAGFTAEGPKKVEKEGPRVTKKRKEVVAAIVGDDQVEAVEKGNTPEPKTVEESATEEYAGVTDAEASAMNDSVRDRARATEIMKQDSSLTLLEAMTQAKAERLSEKVKLYEEYTLDPMEIPVKADLQKRFSEAVVHGTVTMGGKVSYNDATVDPEDWVVAQKTKAAERNIKDRKARIRKLKMLKPGDVKGLQEYSYDGQFQWKTAQEGIDQLGAMVRNAEQYIRDLKTANEYWKAKQPKAAEGKTAGARKEPYLEKRKMLSGREAEELQAAGQLQLDFDTVEVKNPITKEKTTKKEFLGRKWGKDPDIYLVTETGKYQGRFMRLLPPRTAVEKGKAKEATVARPLTLGDLEVSLPTGPSIRLLPYPAAEAELIPVFNHAVINPKTGKVDVSAKGNLRGTQSADVIETVMTPGQEEWLIGSRKFLRYPDRGVVRTVVIKDAKGRLKKDVSGRYDNPQDTVGAQALSGRMPPNSTVYVMDKFPKGAPMIWIYRVGSGELATRPGAVATVKQEKAEPLVADRFRAAKEAKFEGKDLTPVPKGMNVQMIPMHEMGISAEERYDAERENAEERVLSVIGLEDQHTIENVGGLLKQLHEAMDTIAPALKKDAEVHSTGIEANRLDPEKKRRYKRLAARYTHGVQYLENRLDALNNRTPRHKMLKVMSRLLAPDVTSVPIYIKIPVEGLRKDLRAKYPRGSDTERMMNNGDRFAITKPMGVVNVRGTVKFDRVDGVWQAVEVRRRLDLSSPEGRAEWEAFEGIDLDYAKRDPVLSRQVFADNAVQTIFRKVGVDDEGLAAEGYVEGGPEAAQEQSVPGVRGYGRTAAEQGGAAGVGGPAQAGQAYQPVSGETGVYAAARAAAFGKDAKGERGGAHFPGRSTFKGERQVKIDGVIRQTSPGFQRLMRVTKNSYGGTGMVIIHANEEVLEGSSAEDRAWLNDVVASTMRGMFIVVGSRAVDRITPTTFHHEGAHTEHRKGNIDKETIRSINAQAVSNGKAAMAEIQKIVRSGVGKLYNAAKYLQDRIAQTRTGEGLDKRAELISIRQPQTVLLADLSNPSDRLGLEVAYDTMFWPGESVGRDAATIFRQAGIVIDTSDIYAAYSAMTQYIHSVLALEAKMPLDQVNMGHGDLQGELLANHVGNNPVLADQLFDSIASRYESSAAKVPSPTGPQIRKTDMMTTQQTTGPPGQPTSNIAQPPTNPGLIMRIRAMEMPEIIRFAKAMQGDEGRIRLWGKISAPFGEKGKFNSKAGQIDLSRDLFKDDKEATAVVAAQVGHLVDYMDEKLVGLTRGNILGRTAKLKMFMKHHYQELASRDEITEELQNVSQLQIPFNEDTVPKAYLRHRYSSKELYADAISMLVNDPVLLEKTAPKFYAGFFEYLHRMPKVMKIYNKIQADLMDESKLNQGRLELTRKGFQETKKEFDREVEEEKVSQKAWWRVRAQNFYFHFIDKNQRTLTAIKGLRKLGITLDPERDPTYWLSEAPYVDGLLARYNYHVNDEVVKVMVKNDIDKDDFDAYLKYGRVIEYQLKGQAFPGGYRLDTATDQYEALKDKVGEDKLRMMGELKKTLFNMRQKYVVPYVEKSEILSDENLRLMKTNEDYVTFMDKKFVKEMFDDDGEFRGMKSQVFATTGNLNDELLSPFTATVLKDMALIRATHQKMAVKTTVAALRAFWGDQEVKDATRGAGGRINPAPSGFDTIIMKHKGVTKGFYVRPEVAKQFKTDPYMAHHIAKTAMFMANISKQIFVRYNPVWIIRNLPRDIVDSYKKMRGFSLPSIIKEIITSKGIAWDYIFKDLWNSDVDEMMAGQMLVTGRAFDPSRETTDAAVSRMKQMQFMYGKDIQQADKHRKRFYTDWLQAIDKFGQFTEALTKIASYRLSKQYVDKLAAEKSTLEGISSRSEKQNKRLKWVKEELGWVAAPKRMAYNIRNRAGTPDIYRRGNLAWLYNTIFMFSNVGKEGWREHWSTLTDEYRIHGNKNLFESDYMWKTIKTTILPKMVMLLASFGLLGDYWKKFFDNISEYNKSVNIIIPTGMTDKGESTYLRIAPDYGAQMIGSVFYRMVSLLYEGLNSDKFKYNPTEWSNFFDFVLDTNPYGNVHPMLGLMYETSELLRGANPYDGFTSKPIVPEYIMKTGDNWLITKTFLGYAANKMGASIMGKNPFGLFTFKSETVPYQEKELYTELTEKVPILGPMAWTYWQVSNYGRRQRYEWVSTVAERREAKGSYDRRQAIWKSLEEQLDAGRKPTTTAANNLYRELVRNGTVDRERTSWENFKNMYTRYALRTENNREIDMIVFARSNREKAELLDEYQRVLPPEEYNRVVYHLRREGQLTSETMSALRKLKWDRQKQERR